MLIKGALNAVNSPPLGWRKRLSTACVKMMTSSQMETFSALLALFARNLPVNSPHKGQWHGALVFSLICAWTNGWVNNRDACELRGYRAHYGVTVMNKVGIPTGHVNRQCIAIIVYPLRGTQLVTEIWRLTSWLRRLTSWILLRCPS